MIKHRHVYGRYGVNIILCLQNYKSQGGTLSRALRQNLTLLSLFGYRDAKLIDSISDEIAREVTPEQFAKLYDYCCSGEKFNHITIEFGSKIRFRRNLDEVVTIGNIPTKENVTEKDGDSENDFNR